MSVCPSCGVISTISARRCEHCGWSPARVNGFVAYAPQLDDTNEGFNPDQFAQLAELEEKNFWFRIRNKLIARFARKYAADSRDVLEVGCGTGFVLSALARALPGANLYGSELHSRGLTFAARRVPTATLFQMDARRIPFRNELDLIGAFDVVEHIHEDERVLEEIFGALRNGGHAILTVPQHPALWSRQDELASHVRRYKPKELEAKLTRAGFNVVYSTSFVALLLPAMALSRFRKRGPIGDVDPASEFRIPAVLNALLYAVLKIEYAVISMGFRFPLGGSRLVVAYKDSE